MTVFYTGVDLHELFGKGEKVSVSEWSIAIVKVTDFSLVIIERW